MYKTDIDARQLTRGLSRLEREQLPFALATALNNTAFEDVRPGWKDEMLQVFDRPTRLTLNAVLVNKATKRRLFADVYIRDEASKGTPPSRYLAHHVTGGVRPRKPFENLLERAGLISPGEYAIPGKSYPLDAYGNVPGRTITAILSDVRSARGGADAFSTAASRRRRERRRTKRGGLYFASRGDRGLPRGIYERIRTGFGVAVRTVFVFTKDTPDYRARFDPEGITRDLFNRNFPRRFRIALRLAVQSARGRGSRGRRR